MDLTFLAAVEYVAYAVAAVTAIGVALMIVMLYKEAKQTLRGAEQTLTDDEPAFMNAEQVLTDAERDDLAIW